jgi:adhesin transport system membrane fusion protein
VLFFAWAYWAKIDQITRAPGSVISSSRSQIIQSQDGGVIEELMVREGDVVQRDQVLVKIDSTRQQSGYLETRAKSAGLAITVARLQADVLGREPKFPPEAKDYPEFRDTQLMLFSKRQSAIAMRRCLADLPMGKDIIVTTTEEIARRGYIVGTVLHQAITEGKVIYEQA